MTKSKELRGSDAQEIAEFIESNGMTYTWE